MGTDAGVDVYNPLLEDFTVFDRVSDTGDMISRAVTRIESDEDSDIWISVDYQGLFHFDRVQDRLINCLHRDKRKNQLANVTRFWFEEKLCWVSLYDDNLYYTKDNFKTLFPFQDSEGKEPFKDDIINTWIMGPHNCWYIGSSNGLTEINLTTGRVRRLLNYYVRDLGFKSDKELWVGTESGLYIYDLEKGEIAHLTVSNGNDSYALADNAIYSICRDNEGGMWIGSYFGGVNYYPRQWTYFEKFYPRDDIKNFGRRVREFCESNDGTVWIGTEDKGLFHFYPESGKIEKFSHPSIYQNVHGLCLDGDDLWVGTFSGGLSRIDLLTKQVRHYQKGISPNSLDANNVFSICKTTSGDLWIGTTSGLLRYNRDTDDFTRMPELANMFVYKILEDFNGNLWLATYSNGVFRYDVNKKEWKNFIFHKNDSTSLPYDKVISICEDSRKRLWFMTQGAGFCRFNPENESFTRFDMSKGFPSNIIYRMVEDNWGNLWLTTNNGLVCFNPETDDKRVYTTANGLLSNQFNYQSGYKDKMGRIYLGSINGFITFDPSTFVENTFVPPVVITDFFLFNKRMQIGSKDSPLKESIVFSDEVELESDQNSFSLHAAALGYQAPEMNQLVYKMEGFDKEWYNVGRNSVINYSNLPYGTYIFHLRGSNSDGKWNTVPTMLEIIVLPIWYKTWWAIMIFLATFIGFITFVFRFFWMRKSMEAELELERRDKEHQEEINQMKMRFFINISHELRTPLTLILAPLQEIINKISDRWTRNQLEYIQRNANRLLHLVNQLMDYRRAELGVFELKVKKENAHQLIQDNFLFYDKLARHKKITYTLHSELEEKEELFDPNYLELIVNNLLSNAFKYTESGQSITVTLKEENNWLVLQVSDTGIGIPINKQGKIFERFYQIESEHVGSGIGLSLVQRLVELHHGRIELDSEEGKGSTFSVYLPQDINIYKSSELASNDAKNEEDQVYSTNSKEMYFIDTEKVENETIETGDKKRGTILIVEDNNEIRHYLSSGLAELFNTLEAGNGEEALEKLKENEVDIIVTDVMMPVMDGIKLCKNVKQNIRTCHIPVIILSAKSETKDQMEGLQMGADDYIPKPFSLAILTTKIQNMMRTRRRMLERYSKSLEVEPEKITFNAMDEALLKRAVAIVEKNMDNIEFSTDEFAREMNMSRSNLHLKLKAITGESTIDFIRKIRFNEAAKLLKDGRYTIAEVSTMVGFNTPSYFATSFKKYFGCLPTEYIKKAKG